MRTLLFFSLLLVGCSSSDMCRTLTVGTDVSGFKKNEITASSDYVFRAMVSRVSEAPYRRGSPEVWNEGPDAEKTMCCASQENGFTREWCTAEELECTDTGLKIYVLAAPHSDDSNAPNEASYCFVATKEGRVLAFWHRFWS